MKEEQNRQRACDSSNLRVCMLIPEVLSAIPPSPTIACIKRNDKTKPMKTKQVYSFKHQQVSWNYLYEFSYTCRRICSNSHEVRNFDVVYMSWALSINPSPSQFIMRVPFWQSRFGLIFKEVPCGQGCV